MSYINSLSNKQMLWNLLIQKVDDPDFNYEEFNVYLDNLCNFYKKTDSDKMNQINKLILESCFNYIQERKLDNLYNRPNVVKDRHIIKPNNKMSKEDEFNELVSKKKESYESLLNENKPSEIDFGREKDKPMDNETIELIVKKEIENRNNNIKQISENYLKDDKVQSWLNVNKKETKENKNDEIIKLLNIIIDNQNNMFKLLKPQNNKTSNQ